MDSMSDDGRRCVCTAAMADDEEKRGHERERRTPTRDDVVAAKAKEWGTKGEGSKVRMEERVESRVSGRAGVVTMSMSSERRNEREAGSNLLSDREVDWR